MFHIPTSVVWYGREKRIGRENKGREFVELYLVMDLGVGKELMMI